MNQKHHDSTGKGPFLQYSREDFREDFKSQLNRVPGVWELDTSGNLVTQKLLDKSFLPQGAKIREEKEIFVLGWHNVISKMNKQLLTEGVEIV